MEETGALRGWDVAGAQGEERLADVVTAFTDGLGELHQLIDDARNTTTIVYDASGLKSQMSDPDMATLHYAHNGFGELVWQRDAKNEVVALGGNGGLGCFWEPVAICDRFRASVSVRESRNRKSSGKPLGVALTCSFSRLVVTS